MATLLAVDLTPAQLRVIREEIARRDVRCARCNGDRFALEAVALLPCTRFLPPTSPGAGVGTGPALMMVAPLACEDCAGALTFISLGFVDR